jgi:hypothetical protein
VIWNLDPTNVGQQAIAIFIEQYCHGWTVKNNVIYNVGWGGIRHNPQTSGPVNQYLNNTIYNVGVHSIALYSGNAVVMNNVLALGAASQIYVTGNAISQGNLMIDYNDYWSAGGGTRIGQWNTGSAQTFATWTSACKCDGHSINVDPLFVDAPSDLHLQSPSPARGAGQDGSDMGAYP